MSSVPEGVRDVRSVRLPVLGSVVADPVSLWAVIDADGTVHDAAARFLIDLRAAGCSPLTVRSYAQDLLRWFRFLAAVDVPWTYASRAEVRDLVRWMQVAENPQRRRPVGVRPPPGSLNPETGKAYLSSGYAPRTINHQLTVLGSFYEFTVDESLGPMVNPVPSSRRTAAFGVRRAPRARYRQRTPAFQPRAISESLLQRLFAVLGNDRDRALVAVALSSGARAGELLSMTRGGVDAGAGVLSVVPKGRGGSRLWIPAAPESFVWIGRYLTKVEVGGPMEPLWLTLREPRKPLNYMALRQVLERANRRLGTNLTWHDLRHTFTHRLLADDNLAITDVQELVRHRNLDSLATYAASRLDELVAHLHAHLSRPPVPPPTAAPGYDVHDLQVLFPEMRS